MIEIQPIQLGLPPSPATKIMIRVMINSTTDLSCMTYYEVSGEESGTLASGNVPITEEEYTLWGDDNSYIENIVLNKLGLQRKII